MVEYEYMINYDKCTGCRLCEIACAIAHGFEADPQRAAIRIVNLREEAHLVSIPSKCMHCEKPSCQLVCPVDAISADPTTGAKEVDKKKCIGCSACVFVCPFGAIVLDREVGNPLVCDLCDGEPACVRFCPFEALQFVRSDKKNILLKRARMDKLLECVKRSSNNME